MYKKYIQYIRRVPFTVTFLFLLQRSLFMWRNHFLKDWNGRSWRGPSVFKVFNWLCCVLCCCHDNTLRLVRHPAQDKMGWKFHQLLSLLSIQGNNSQTFVNCMQQNGKLYHYFEIVYVKVIFLHVDCCYFVF